MSFLDPRTNDSELEVQRIIHLQSVANRLPDAFIDTKKVTKSHIPAENVQARLEVPEATLTQTKTSESQIRRKRGRPLGSKDANPQKRKEHTVPINHDANVTTSNVSEDKIPEVILYKDPKRNEKDLEDSYEMSINSAHNSLVMDATTLRFLISLSVIEQLKMQLMDVVTAYLYGSLDTDIYMRIPEGLKMPKALKSKLCHMYSIKLKRSFKQSGRMWYNHFSEYLIKKGFCHNQISPCLFIKRTESGFVIIALYVDDLNIIGSPEEIRQAADYLKSEFKMKDLSTTKYYLGLQFEHTKSGIFIHQSNYIEKVLKRFHMNNAHPLSTPMVVRSLDVNKDPFRPPAYNDEILGPEVPYLSVIGALMYLANNT
ncbi:Retrovirus-related Pol polyprotein from transposon TNT 1-94 [Sesamum angolense]|uniref:Retrovirus-related Pol polyprotein from transposon TNT 1-94 n=1 Tax=Sesamum angolense TaxID=2727404 RepID=A0AAE2C290_9LAMI|nr:Retrovirus-related Pol polyprotein from transposon TNT 1-94 [Sesamum angolense]